MKRSSGKGTVTVRIDANVRWDMAFDPASGTYIGVCPMLNLNAIGDTWMELQECANEAMQLLLLDLLDSGELDDFLRRNGWALTDAPPEPGRKVRFDVPFGVYKGRIQELVPA